MKEASLKSFMENPYNTRMWKKIVYSRKKRRQREIEDEKHRASS
jgi:hypothetical protein